MTTLRKWTTPLLTGTFLVSGVTGILMFFHAASSLARVAHEWTSWALVAAAALHLVVNSRGLWVSLRTPVAKVAVACFAALTLVAAVTPSKRTGELNPGEMRMLSQPMMESPLDRVAGLLGTAPDRLREKVEARGLKVPAGSQTLREVIRANGGQARPVLEAVFQ